MTSSSFEAIFDCENARKAILSRLSVHQRLTCKLACKKWWKVLRNCGGSRRSWTRFEVEMDSKAPLLRSSKVKLVSRDQNDVIFTSGDHLLMIHEGKLVVLANFAFLRLPEFKCCRLDDVIMLESDIFGKFLVILIINNSFLHTVTIKRSNSGRKLLFRLLRPVLPSSSVQHLLDPSEEGLIISQILMAKKCEESLLIISKGPASKVRKFDYAESFLEKVQSEHFQTMREVHRENVDLLTNLDGRQVAFHLEQEEELAEIWPQTICLHEIKVEESGGVKIRSERVRKLGKKLTVPFGDNICDLVKLHGQIFALASSNNGVLAWTNVDGKVMMSKKLVKGDLVKRESNLSVAPPLPFLCWKCDQESDVNVNKSVNKCTLRAWFHRSEVIACLTEVNCFQVKHFDIFKGNALKNFVYKHEIVNNISAFDCCPNHSVLTFEDKPLHIWKGKNGGDVCLQMKNDSSVSLPGKGCKNVATLVYDNDLFLTIERDQKAKLYRDQLRGEDVRRTHYHFSLPSLTLLERPLVIEAGLPFVYVDESTRFITENDVLYLEKM